MIGVMAGYASDVCQILALLVLVVNPVREWLLGTGVIREGLRCLLRSEIVGLYYRRRESRQLKEYEYQNLEFCYRAYKALKGNSFAEHIYCEMQEWEIV